MNKALLEGDIESARKIQAELQDESIMLSKLTAEEQNPQEKFKMWISKKKEQVVKMKEEKEKKEILEKRRSILKKSILGKHS